VEIKDRKVVMDLRGLTYKEIDLYATMVCGYPHVEEALVPSFDLDSMRHVIESDNYTWARAFNIDFDDLPLYIDQPIEPFSSIIRWRLAVGR
jgi:hypothetical protein